MISLFKHVLEEIDGDVTVITDSIFKSLDGVALGYLKQTSKDLFTNSYKDTVNDRYVHFMNFTNLESFAGDDKVLLVNPFSYEDYRLFKTIECKELYVFNFDHETYVKSQYYPGSPLTELAAEFKLFIEESKGFIHSAFYEDSDFVKYHVYRGLPFVLFRVKNFYDESDLECKPYDNLPNQLTHLPLTDILERYSFPTFDTLDTLLVDTDLEFYCRRLMRKNVVELNYLWRNSSFKTFGSAHLIRRLFPYHDVNIKQQGYILSIELKLT